VKVQIPVRRAFLPIFEDGKRWFVVVAHRRAGKTVAVLQRIIRDALNPPHPNSQYALIAPTYSQAKSIAFDYLRRMTADLDATVHETELRVELPNGSRIRLFGAETPDRLRGIRLDGCVIDEVAQCPANLFGEIIRPALADRKGWCGYIGTPKGRGPFYDVYQNAKNDPEWTALMLRADETGIIDDEELNSLKRTMTSEEWEQEFLLSWDAAVRGAYYAKELRQAFIGPVPHDPSLSVTTAFDLGIDDSSIVLFLQRAGSEVRMINSLEFQGSSLADIVREMDKLPYRYDAHCAPHDTRVRELGTGVSREEVLKQLGVRVTIAPNLPVVDGINAVKMLLPRMAFDEKNCRRCYDALATYRTDFDPKRGVYRLQPLHTWESHFADALRMFAVTKARPEQANAAYDDWATPINY
jgi:hypothetical protein